MKRYWVSYRGTSYGMYVDAKGPKDAIKQFAEYEKKPVNVYMTWRRVN